MSKTPPDDSWTRHTGHGEGFVLPPEREVDCSCDPRLQRPVWRDPTGWNNRVTACMRCGKVTLVESLVDEPQPHDVRCVGNRIEPVSPTVLAWLAAWPRLAWGVWQEDRAIYLPATLRCASAEELELREREFLVKQRGMSAAERLLSVGVPEDAAPAGLAPHLKSFAQTQTGLRLGPDTDLETLLSHANRSDWAMPFAFEHLKKRADFTAVVVGLLKNAENGRRDLGISLVQFGKIKEPEVVETVIGLLKQAPIDPEGQAWLGTLLDTLYSIGPAASAARPILLEMAQKIGDRDYYLRKRVEQVRELIK